MSPHPDEFGGEDVPHSPSVARLRADIEAHLSSSPMLPSSTIPDTLPDSGARTEFGTGAVRDASVGKGHFHSIPPTALRHLATRFEAGAKKYQQDNYMKGISLRHYMDSLMRHLLAWHEGDETEDHAGALLWNAAVMVWTDEEIKAGRLPKELDTLPYRKRS